jgi:O-antigen/teichoic acid export membrane protein
MHFENIEQKYFFNIFRLLRGAVLIQAIQLIGTFILTFYFRKENFGVLSFVLSVSSVFEMVAGLQYNTAAVVNPQKKNALQLMSVAVLSTILFSTILFFCIIISKFFIPSFYSNIYMQGFVKALPFFIVSTFIFNNGILLLKYFGKIREINKFRTIYVLITLFSKFIAAFFFGTVNSLIYAHLLGVIITAAGFVLKYNLAIKTTLSEITLKETLGLIKANYRFPKYAISSSVINAASNISFPILITLFFGPAENGIYYLTVIFIFQPLLLLLQAISDAFLPKVKSIFNENNLVLFHFIKSQQKIILKILIPYFIIAILAGEFLFPYLLPAQWVEIGKFIKFQILYYFFTSLYTPFSIVADYMKKQQFLMIFNFSHFFFQFCILFFLHDKLGFNFTILLVSIVSAIHYCYINFYMLQKLKLYK